MTRHRRHYLEGRRYTLLVVLHRDPNSGSAYLCACDCGGMKSVQPWFLLKGKVKSCGCLGAREERNAKILSLYKQGCTRKEIAAEIGVKPHIVSNVKSNARAKKIKESRHGRSKRIHSRLDIAATR